MASLVESSALTVYVNGKIYSIRTCDVDPRTTLLTFLRSRGLTGTKLGCGEGGCGACTVMISHYSEELNRIRHLSANACLTPLCSLDGYHVTTVEGIGNSNDGLHPVQQRIASLHGSQCGYCTPGIIMALYAHLREFPDASPQELEDAMDGNLCRCTGYRPIIDAIKSLSKWNDDSPCGPNCACMNAKCSESDIMVSNTELVLHQNKSLDKLLSEGLAEPIFPPALMKYAPKHIEFTNAGITWVQPLDLGTLMSWKEKHPTARIIVGNTEVGIEIKFKGMDFPVFINPSYIPELKAIRVEEGGIRFGAAVTINRIREFILNLESNPNPTSPVKPYMLRGLVAFKDMMSWFASNHIRNVASIGGNIVTASPISDVNPMLISLNAKLRIISINATREQDIKTFFLGYRRVNLQPNEVIQDILIPFTDEFEFVVPFKQARRREDDISIVTGGLRFHLTPLENQWVISDCDISFGGMAPTSIRAARTTGALINQPWTSAVIDKAMEEMRGELSLPDNVPGGQAEYRLALSVSSLFRSYIKVTLDLQKYLSTIDALQLGLPAAPLVASSDESAADGFISLEKPHTRGEQSFARATGGLSGSLVADDTRSPVGDPIVHKSADLQVTGEALYVDDIKLPGDTLHAALVLSQRAHARILSLDFSEAEKSAGFVGYATAKDVKGTNMIGVIIKDEEVFVTEEAKYFGAVLAVVVAQTHQQAWSAALKVKVQYEDLPAILNIKDAIANQSFYPEIRTIDTGDHTSAEKDSTTVVEGEMYIGGQEHFYLETMCSVLFPKERGHMEILAATQDPTKTQYMVASVLGVPNAHVVGKAKRVGGGFGGKETRGNFIACAAAVAAQKYDRVVKVMVERDVDMSITGQRHPFYCKYRAGCDANGKLTFLQTDLYNNGGYSYDLSYPVMDRAVFHVDNAYKFQAIRVNGRVCRTNLPSNTAFRGFGGPQGMMLAETVVEHLAQVSGIDIHRMRTINLYQNGDSTHYLQKLSDLQVPKLWNQIHEKVDVAAKRVAIDEFNSKNRWKKRGMCILPTKFGINFTLQTYNQAGALVHIYTDGSVLVSHGGTEMGQGLHTKMIQVAARQFQIPDSMIHIEETATNTIPNASPTAGSASTDLYGMAVLDACTQIMSRLKPIIDSMPGKPWEEIIHTAYFKRVNLSAQGFYIVPGDRCGFDWNLSVEENATNGVIFNYYTEGVALSEVEIDVLTGDSRILRSDVLMDLGKSINPSIDIGQVEGAFIQGFGWSTMEELLWGDPAHPWVRPGQLFSRGPGFYKIPGFNDVPCEFNVHLANTSNKFAIHSSKAVGEPPFFLGASVFFAIKDAIKYARADNGNDSYYPLYLPASSERIRMACADGLSQACAKNNAQFTAKGSW